MNSTETGNPVIVPWDHRRRPGRHRKPESFSMLRHVTVVLVTSALVLSSCGTPAPAAPPAASSWTADSDWTPAVTPVTERRIEIVDGLKPAKWHVRAAAEWLDRYTGSDMVTVPRCSGHAWKCVVVQDGRLSGNALAKAQLNGTKITVDTVKVDKRGYHSDRYRKRILAHELAHIFGLPHTDTRTLMATTLGRVRFFLDSGQRAHLRAR